VSGTSTSAHDEVERLRAQPTAAELREQQANAQTRPAAQQQQ